MGLKNVSSYEEQAKKLLSKLTLEEKVSLMAGNYVYDDLMIPLQKDPLNKHYNWFPYEAGGIEKYNIPPLKFVDGPRGAVCSVGEATCFPVSMLRGASFNKELEEKIGQAIGKEIRAFGGNYFGGVCINLPYHPGWGRSQETYGEETYHIGQMGIALTKGIQSQDVIACAKHYAFNQMENARFDVSVTCDARTEREVFLPHFKDCIDAGVKSVMSSYNRYNGTYCGQHNYLLNEVLKEEWGFDGFVISDFGWGVRDTVLAANSGQDIEMCLRIYFGDKLVTAVNDGFVNIENIDKSVFRILKNLLAVTDSDVEVSKENLASKEHIQLALDAAKEGITLIKNNNYHLPFTSKEKKILLLGKLANADNLGDFGSSQVYPPYVNTIFNALEKNIGSENIIYDEGDDLDKVKELIKQVDEVITVVGCNHNDEGEYIAKENHDNYKGATGGDRFNLDLHEEDIDLIKHVGTHTENQNVILIGGNTLLMNKWENFAKTVIMAFYPGMEGGQALYEILYGETNPSGKLPYVVPFEGSDLPQVDWHAKDQYYEYYHGYTRLEKNNVTPQYYYGHGLSYTTFDIDFKELTNNVDQNKLIVKACVTNTGDVEGKEVVQVYAGYENSKIDRPVKQLCAFDKVSLKPQETREIDIEVNLDKLKWYNPVLREWEFEDIIYNIHVGNSSDTKHLNTKSIYIN